MRIARPSESRCVIGAYLCRVSCGLGCEAAHFRTCDSQVTRSSDDPSSKRREFRYVTGGIRTGIRKSHRPVASSCVHAKAVGPRNLQLTARSHAALGALSSPRGSMGRMIAPHPSTPVTPARTARTVRKAVVPAAGLGTRFLPATKATPKEMLPVVDKPAIQYVVEEAAAAGLDDVLMVTGRHKRAIEDHFDHAFELEQALAAKGDTVRLDAVRDPGRLASIHHIRQGDPLGLGHAVLCARRHVGDQPFAVLLGDDLIDPRETLLSRMLDVRDRHLGSVVALLEVPAGADPPLRLRRRRTDRRGGRRPCHRPGREAGPAGRAEPLRRHRALRPRPGRLRRPGAHPAGPGRRDPADRRPPGAGRGRHGARSRLQGPALRHRGQGGLSAHGGPAGLRPARSGAGVRGVAQGLRRGAGRRPPCTPRTPARRRLEQREGPGPGFTPSAGTSATRQRDQPLGRSVQTTVISPVTAPSARWMAMATGNSGTPARVQFGDDLGGRAAEGRCRRRPRPSPASCRRSRR
ncbi:UTP--glucose-1-phosphate uridylyltransferase [Streptomyces purpurascens]